MTGKKRTRNGQIKAPTPVEQQPPIDTDATMTEPSPPCAQPHIPSSTSTEPQIPSKNVLTTKKQKQINLTTSKPTTTAPASPKPQRQPTKSNPRRKLQKLPSNAKISKRPLLHPALPQPCSSSSSPKTLYITATTPFIPCLKRIRALLADISKREKQSFASQTRNTTTQGRKRGVVEANGRLEARDVARGIVEGANQGGNGNGKVEGEKVYLKATGRAIPRALEVAVSFQGEGEFVVMVEMGSVSAIDDIELRRGTGEGERSEGEKVEEVDIPESRVRMLSSVTVSIGMK